MMKRFLPLTVFALVLSSSAAFAQSSYTSGGKGDGNMMNDARYIDEEKAPAPVQTSATTTTTQPSTSYVQTSSTQTEPPKDSMEDFKGPYVGGDIGYNIGSYDVNDPAGPDGDVGLDGWEGGLFAGYGFSYDFDWLGGYLGLEGGYEWSGADGDMDGTSFEKDHAWLLTLRPGITMHEDALAYGIIGYSRANFESGNDDEDLNGLVVGAGSEFSTRSPLKIRLEYTYTNYEDTDLGGVNFDGHENQIKAGAVFRL
jgi:opacity protein-like surface antigen